MSATDDILQLAYMHFTPPKLPVVTKCLTVFSQLDWQITIAGAVVLRENHSLSSLSQRIEAVSDFVSIFQGLTTWALCTRNSDMHFVETVQDILQSSQTLALVAYTPVRLCLHRSSHLALKQPWQS